VVDSCSGVIDSYSRPISGVVVMDLSDGVRDGMEMVADITEFLFDPPALADIEIEFPVYPRLSNHTNATHEPYLYGTVWHTTGTSATILLVERSTYSGQYGWTSQQWDEIYLYHKSHRLQPQSSVYDYAQSTPSTAEHVVIPTAKASRTQPTWNTTESPTPVAWRWRGPKEDQPVIGSFGTVTVTQSDLDQGGSAYEMLSVGSTYPTMTILSDTTLDNIQEYDRLRFNIARRTSVRDMLDVAIYWPQIPAITCTMSTAGAIPNNINTWVEDLWDEIRGAINPIMDDLTELITDNLISIGIALADFVTQFIWKDVIRDFVIKWLLTLGTYGLRVLIAMPSYFLGKFVLDQIFPKLDARDLRRPFDGLLSQVGAPLMPSAEAGAAEVQEWATLTLSAFTSTLKEGWTHVDLDIGPSEVFNLVSVVFDVVQEVALDGN